MERDVRITSRLQYVDPAHVIDCSFNLFSLQQIRHMLRLHDICRKALYTLDTIIVSVHSYSRRLSHETMSFLISMHLHFFRSS